MSCAVASMPNMLMSRVSRIVIQICFILCDLSFSINVFTAYSFYLGRRVNRKYMETKKAWEILTLAHP